MTSNCLVLILFLSHINSTYENELFRRFNEKDITKVQEQYSRYPYPFVDPKLEKTKKSIPINDGPFMLEINHFLYNGNGDLGRNKIFRILIAGGGTGYSLLHYAYVFKAYKTEIVYLDFSKKSLEIARERAKNFGYQNILFYHDSIYNIPNLKLGLFDFIDCYGVLHHLAEPDEGLRILKNSLAPDGGIFLMLYAYYGRQGLYLMQELLKILNENRNLSYHEEVQRSRLCYNNHLENSWIHMQGIFKEAESDVGFYDMYLHKQDLPFTLSELYEYIEQSEKNELKVVDFYYPVQRNWMNQRPAYLNKLSKRKLQIVNEIIYGYENKHIFFVSKKNDSVASLNNMDNIPIFQVEKISPIISVLTSHENINKLHIRITKHNQMKDVFSLPVSKYTYRFFKLLSQRKFTIQEIIEDTVKLYQKKGKDAMKLQTKIFNDFKKTLKVLILNGLILLRHKHYSNSEFVHHDFSIFDVEYE